MNKQELEKIVGIVNKYIKGYGLSITENDIKNTSSTDLIYLKNDVIEQIFSRKAVSQKGINRSYFHYKSFDLAYDFIDNEYITLSALSNFSGLTDDLLEYKHFFDTIGIGTSTDIIKEYKNNFFVFCLSEDNNTDRFWEEYAKSKTGLCIEFMIVPTSDAGLNSQFELRTICYDDGQDFYFYRDMQKEVEGSKIKKGIAPNGIAKFGALYKRKAQYNWERETRLFFNNYLYSKYYSNKNLSVIDINKKKFLKINFNNDYFILTVKSVKIGKNITPDNRTKIIALTK
jgi:hypothetical protein